MVAARSYMEARRAAAHPDRHRLTIAGIDADIDEVLQNLTGPLASRLPANLSSLDRLARSVAQSGAGMVLGANTKHMTRRQNEVLARSYVNVRASLGKGKFRCLLAEDSRHPDLHQPVSTDTSYGRLYGFGSCFGGASVDRGGEFLARSALADLTGSENVIDLGCGNGLVSLMVADHVASVRATDVDLDAVRAARLTLGERAEVTWDDAGREMNGGSADVVLLNPPFHANAGIDTSLVDHLLASAHRLLRPGGRLYLVFNSHLRYRARLAPWHEVTQVARNSKFTVLRGTR